MTGTPLGPDQRANQELTAVLRASGQALFHYARVLSGSEPGAEDALHDTLLAFLDARAKGNAPREPRAWLFAVLRRMVRRNRRPREKAAGDLARSLGAAVEADPAERMALEEAFATLDARTQEVVLLHCWEGLSFSEIAQVLEMPRGTALSLWHRGIARLRERLGEDIAPGASREEGTIDEHTAAAFPA